MIMPENSGIEEKEPEELEKLTYGKTTLRLLKIDGDYQVEKRNEQEVVNIIDYTEVGTHIKGVYNSEIENAFMRIRQARGHVDQFYKEKQGLALQVDDLDLEVNHSDLRANNKKGLDYLNKPITSDLEKPMVFTIVRKSRLTSHLDFLDVDETV